MVTPVNLQSEAGIGSPIQISELTVGERSFFPDPKNSNLKSCQLPTANYYKDLMGVDLMGVHLMGLHLMGVDLMGVRLTAYISWACISWACISRACISQACILSACTPDGRVPSRTTDRLKFRD